MIFRNGKKGIRACFGAEVGADGRGSRFAGVKIKRIISIFLILIIPAINILPAYANPVTDYINEVSQNIERYGVTFYDAIYGALFPPYLLARLDEKFNNLYEHLTESEKEDYETNYKLDEDGNPSGGETRGGGAGRGERGYIKDLYDYYVTNDVYDNETVNGIYPSKIYLGPYESEYNETYAKIIIDSSSYGIEKIDLLGRVLKTNTYTYGMLYFNSVGLMDEYVIEKDGNYHLCYETIFSGFKRTDLVLKLYVKRSDGTYTETLRDLNTSSAPIINQKRATSIDLGKGDIIKGAYITNYLGTVSTNKEMLVSAYLEFKSYNEDSIDYQENIKKEREQRAGTIINNYYNINNDNSVTSYNQMLMDEQNDKLYNPYNNTEYDMSGWIYDYSTRTYSVNTGDTITYGDNYITIHEGDTNTNYYYYYGTPYTDSDGNIDYGQYNPNNGNYNNDTSSGGGDDNNGDDDNNGGSWWDDLLKDLLGGLGESIVNLFNSIGYIIGNLINGILDLLTNLVDSLSNVTSLMDGVSGLITGLFSWLPPEISIYIGSMIALLLLIGFIKLLIK